jgi:phosphoglycolate phosphatase-like HAD superfamily hydrolase
LRWNFVLLDWDGTLLDDVELGYQTMQAVFRHYGLGSPPRDVWMEGASRDILGFYHQYGVPAHVTIENIYAIWDAHFNRNWNGLQLRDAAQEVLQICYNARVPIAIVSGSSTEVVADGVNWFKLSHMIAHIEGGAGDKVRALRDVLARFSVRAASALYVDDTYKGVSAAKEVGITAIGIRGGFNTDECLNEAAADRYISNLRELIPLLNAT